MQKKMRQQSSNKDWTQTDFPIQILCIINWKIKLLAVWGYLWED